MADTTIPTRLLDALRLHSDFAGEIRPEHSLIGDLGLDSLEVVALSLDLEETPEFPGKLTDDDIDGWQTVGDVIQTLAKGAVQ